VSQLNGLLVYSRRWYFSVYKEKLIPVCGTSKSNAITISVTSRYQVRSYVTLSMQKINLLHCSASVLLLGKPRPVTAISAGVTNIDAKTCISSSTMHGS
jgi:hypothetical protein